MLKNGYAGRIIWFALALVLLAAILVPEEWIPLKPRGPQVDAFSSLVAEVDQTLAGGKPVEVSPGELETMRPHLQVRRLLQVGPMTYEETMRASEILREYEAQLRTQTAEGSRQALRNQRDRVLSQELPRLAPAKLSQALETLEGELEAARQTPSSVEP